MYSINISNAYLLTILEIIFKVTIVIMIAELLAVKPENDKDDLEDQDFYISDLKTPWSSRVAGGLSLITLQHY